MKKIITSTAAALIALSTAAPVMAFAHDRGHGDNGNHGKKDSGFTIQIRTTDRAGENDNQQGNQQVTVLLGGQVNTQLTGQVNTLLDQPQVLTKDSTALCTKFSVAGENKSQVIINNLTQFLNRAEQKAQQQQTNNTLKAQIRAAVEQYRTDHKIAAQDETAFAQASRQFVLSMKFAEKIGDTTTVAYGVAQGNAIIQSYNQAKAAGIQSLQTVQTTSTLTKGQKVLQQLQTADAKAKLEAGLLTKATASLTALTASVQTSATTYASTHNTVTGSVYGNTTGSN